MDILFNLDGALQLDFVHIPIAEAMTLKAGDYVEDGDKKGLLLHDGLVGEAEIIEGINCIHAQIVVGGYVDERKILASTGKAVTDDIKAALPNVTFCDNSFPGGGGGGDKITLHATVDDSDNVTFTESPEVVAAAIDDGENTEILLDDSGYVEILRCAATRASSGIALFSCVYMRDADGVEEVHKTVDVRYSDYGEGIEITAYYYFAITYPNAS